MQSALRSPRTLPLQRRGFWVFVQSALFVYCLFHCGYVSVKSLLCAKPVQCCCTMGMNSVCRQRRAKCAVAMCIFGTTLFEAVDAFATSSSSSIKMRPFARSDPEKHLDGWFDTAQRTPNHEVFHCGMKLSANNEIHNEETGGRKDPPLWATTYIFISMLIFLVLFENQRSGSWSLAVIHNEDVQFVWSHKIHVALYIGFGELLSYYDRKQYEADSLKLQAIRWAGMLIGGFGMFYAMMPLLKSGETESALVFFNGYLVIQTGRMAVKSIKKKLDNKDAQT